MTLTGVMSNALFTEFESGIRVDKGYLTAELMRFCAHQFVV
jgi:hypothetical protein